MIRLRWGIVCACLGLSSCGGDSAPGSTGANTTTGPGPTTFATFSTTAPPVTTMPGSSTTDPDESSSESTDTDTDTDTDAESSSTGSGLCPSSHTCALDAPEGWNGPVAVHRAAFDPSLPDAAPPECGTAYPNSANAGFEELLAEPAECSCSCGDANGVACQGSTTLRYWADDNTCGTGVPQTVGIFTGACNSVPDLPGNGHYTADPVVAVGGACPPTTDSTVEPAAWTWHTQACDGAEVIEDAGCADGRACTPLPESEEATLCIWQEGEHACPDGFDSSRTLYGDVEDTRGCETCSCSAPQGLCDAAVVSLWSGGTCLLPAAGVIGADGECDPSGTGNTARAASLNTGSANAFCTASDPTPSGEALGTGPVTICCEDR